MLIRKKYKKEYEIWKSMRQRCKNKNNKAYNNYGGRGITICERWDSFNNFLKDMGEKHKKMTLDRIDNNGNYDKQNCRWATRKEQNNNKRNNVYLEKNGIKKTITNWDNSLSNGSGIVRKRIYRGWDLKRALSEKSNFGKYEKTVYAIKNNKVVISFKSLSSARVWGYNPGHISECCNGKRKIHMGFVWSYKIPPFPSIENLIK